MSMRTAGAYVMYHVPMTAGTPPKIDKYLATSRLRAGVSQCLSDARRGIVWTRADLRALGDLAAATQMYAPWAHQFYGTPMLPRLVAGICERVYGEITEDDRAWRRQCADAYRGSHFRPAPKARRLTKLSARAAACLVDEATGLAPWETDREAAELVQAPLPGL